MKKPLALVLCLFVMLLPPTEGRSSPPCIGSPTASTNFILNWTNCFGTYTDKDGNKYVGEWKGGDFDGQGNRTLANGGKYVGGFKDGKLPGTGAIIFPNGDTYVGQFRFDYIFGQGTYKYGLDGGVKLGITANGNFPYEWEVAERIRKFAKIFNRTRPNTE